MHIPPTITVTDSWYVTDFQSWLVYKRSEFNHIKIALKCHKLDCSIIISFHFIIFWKAFSKELNNNMTTVYIFKWFIFSHTLFLINTLTFLKDSKTFVWTSKFLNKSLEFGQVKCTISFSFDGLNMCMQVICFVINNLPLRCIQK